MTGQEKYFPDNHIFWSEPNLQSGQSIKNIRAFWAAECLILSKKQLFKIEGSPNPLIVLGMISTYQTRAVNLLLRCKGPNPHFLYEIAKISFQEMYHRDILVIEELNNLCDTQPQDYKNMLSSIQTEEESLHTITEQIQMNQKERLYHDKHHFVKR
ncbi:hypothetical protein BDB01DRAFT_432399 [Pilobolus umbonatus]|nr:hypothetical protein BDB01DRAFT_432399 [Pilobolus umbonatus]